MKRRPLIAGNWKMHKTVLEACQLASEIMKECEEVSDRDVILAPPFTALGEVTYMVRESSIMIASQNVCWGEQGAFTGEISPAMLKDIGVQAAIIGHSERRQLFGESNELINKRIHGAIGHGLIPILCIGETLEEREQNRTFDVLEKQVRGGLVEVNTAKTKKLVIAYEPVWAIGTGKTATTEQAQEVHAFIRELLGDIYEKDIAGQVRILYGGSVKPDNVDDLMAQPDIDGALVGGAALEARSFGRIINFKQLGDNS